MKAVIHASEATTGRLPVPGGEGAYRIFIDEKTTGARAFSLLVNQMQPGATGREHTHAVEHGMYILHGRGRLILGGCEHAVEPGTALFVPPGMPHSLACDGDEPLEYVVIYAPGGPEQELRSRGESAFAR